MAAKKLLVETMENGNKELFKAVMNNLKPFGKRKKLCIGTVPLSLLFVDHRYQGLRKHKHLRKLVQNWDECKLAPIILVAHPEENRFAIVDGQGRFLAATELGYDSLDAIILMDAPSDPDERLKFEAEYFIGQDTECEAVKPIEKHLARVIIEDKGALMLDAVLKKYDVSFTHNKGQREHSVLGSYTDTYAIAKSYGENCLEFIFSIIHNANWDNEANGYATFVMRSLRNIYIAHPQHRTEIHEFLSEELRQIDPELFSANGRAFYPKRDHRTACSLYLEDIICKELGIERKIHFENGKVIMFQ